MATRVQDAEIFATNYTTQTRTLTSVGSGNLLAACVVGGTATITHTIADNNGGSWNGAANVSPFTQSSPALRGYIWYAANHASGTTIITWTPSASATGLVGCVEYSGCDTSAPLEDSDGAYNASTTSHATPTLTRASAGAIYAVTQSSSNATWTAGTDFTDLGTGGSARAFHESAEVAAGNRTASATSAASEDAIIIAAAFKNASSGQTGRITAVDAVATYSEKTGRITASDAVVTFNAKTGRITAADAAVTFSEKTGRITAADAAVTFSEKTARITAADAAVTYSEKAARITAVDAAITWQPAAGRVLAVDAIVTFSAKTARVTAVDAAATFSEKTARITAVDAAILWAPAGARIFAVDAVISYATSERLGPWPRIKTQGLIGSPKLTRASTREYRRRHGVD